MEFGVPHGLQVDAGLNELEEGTPTVLCVGPADEELVNIVTKRCRLYEG
jgi:PTH2 family peptidyl-tRNA hydrolase